MPSARATRSRCARCTPRGDAEARGSGPYTSASRCAAAELTLRASTRRASATIRASINGYASARRPQWTRLGAVAHRRQHASRRAFASRGSAGLVKDRVVMPDAGLRPQPRRVTRGRSAGRATARPGRCTCRSSRRSRRQYAGEVQAHGTASGSWTAPSSTVQANARALRLARASSSSVRASTPRERSSSTAGTVTASGSGLDLRASLRGGWTAGAWRGRDRSR